MSSSFFIYIKKGDTFTTFSKSQRSPTTFCCVNMSRSDLPRFDYNTPLGVRRSVRLAMAKVHHSQDSAEKDASAHDLSRRRNFGQLDPRTSSVSFENDAAEELCSNCQRIDFEGAFRNANRKWRPCGVVIAELGRKGIEWGKAACPMCRLFAAVRVQPSSRPTADRSEYHLRALPFLTATGTVFFSLSVPKKLKKADAACFLVLSGKGRSPQVPSRRRKSLRDLIRNHSLSFGVICPVVSSATGIQPRVGTRRLLPDRIEYHQLRNWYNFCASNHGRLCAIDFKEYPEMLKVIDCTTRRVVRAPPNCPYVALSYVWGKQESTAVSSSVSSGKCTEHRILSSDTVPRVISDAMIVTLELGWQYLWVDRYCIDQNDEEKHFQINQMDKVYLCAVTTIIAAAGENANYGLPGVSSTLRRAQPYAMVRGQLLASTMRSSNEAIGSSQWATRGWTYQEAVLSRKRLIFTDDQVFFECKGMSCSESHNVPPALLHGKKLENGCGSSIRGGFFETYGNTDSKDTIIKFWKEVRYFTARKLSYEKDSLNAFMGVANYYRNGQGSQSRPLYTHIGLPLDSDRWDSAEQPYSYGREFVKSLFWWHGGSNILPKRRRVLPSFSWAGWEGIACHPFGSPDFEIEPMVSMIREPRTEPELSSPLGATLDLEAEIVQGQIEVSDKPNYRGLHTSFRLTNWEKSGEENLRTRFTILPRDFLSRHTLSGGQILFIDCVLVAHEKGSDESKLVWMLLIEYHGAIAERIGATFYVFPEEQFRTLPKTRRRIRLG